MTGIVNDLIEFLQEYDVEPNYVALDITPLINRRPLYIPTKLKCTKAEEAFL